jgi:hypothetical protein
VSDSTNMDRLTIAGISVVSGVVLLVLLKLAISYGILSIAGAPAQGPSTPPTHVAATADDSPVTVRGGSVTIRSANGFDCSAKQSTTPVPCTKTVDSNLDESVIYLDGVKDSTGSKPPYPLTPPTNWSIMLTFRQGNDGNGGEDRNHSLQICSAPNCITYGPVSTGTVYLMTDKLEDPKASNWGTPDHIDGSVGVPFHLTYCGTDAKGGNASATGESPCNHIFNVVYTTNGTAPMNGMPGTKGTEIDYRCNRGQCDIGIGHPPALPIPIPPSPKPSPPPSN